MTQKKAFDQYHFNRKEIKQESEEEEEEVGIAK